MALFGIGHGRAKRAIEAGLKHGYFKRRGNDLIAMPIKERGAFNVLMNIKSRTAKVQLQRWSKSQDEIRAPFTLTQICNFIREAVLIYQISKQEDLFDTLLMTKQPKSHIEYKKAMARFKKLKMRSRRIAENGRTMSYKRMTELMCCSKSKAKRISKGLIARGSISRQLNFEETGLDIDEYGKELRKEQSKYLGRGFMVKHDGKVCVQVANSYSVLREVVWYLPKPKTA